jgi:hypothetical protein
MKFLIKDKTPILISYTLCKLAGKIMVSQPVGALALFPFIVVRDTKILQNDEYIRHESIHLRQYVETLLVGILIIGLFQYLYAYFILGKSRLQSYYFMSHEQEAHQNDEDKDYLKKRKFLAFYKYLLPKYRKRMDLINGKRIIYDD